MQQSAGQASLSLLNILQQLIVNFTLCGGMPRPELFANTHYCGKAEFVPHLFTCRSLPETNNTGMSSHGVCRDARAFLSMHLMMIDLLTRDTVYFASKASHKNVLP